MGDLREAAERLIDEAEAAEIDPFSGRSGRRALVAALFALPEMVAVLKVVEAARSLATVQSADEGIRTINRLEVAVDELEALDSLPPTP